jgi:hypothetical protein
MLVSKRQVRYIGSYLLENNSIGFAILLCFCGLLSCNQKDITTKTSIRLKSSIQVFEDKNEKSIFWTKYIFDSKNRLISRVLNDTTYSKSDNTFFPIATTYTYTYDENDFLINRKLDIISTASSSNSLTQFSYFENKLLRERTQNSEIVYNYDDEGKLKNTVLTSLSSGNKQITEYSDDVPKNLQKTQDGYLIKNINNASYYDTNLLIKRFESFINGVVVYFENYEYAQGKTPISALPEWKGFPKIKSLTYRSNIEKSKIKYNIVNGQNVLFEERVLSQDFNEEGYLLKNKGYDLFNIGTSKELKRTLEFTYQYEKY